MTQIIRPPFLVFTSGVSDDAIMPIRWEPRPTPAPLPKLDLGPPLLHGSRRERRARRAQERRGAR